MTIATKIKTRWKRKLNETKLIEINRLLRSNILRCAIKNKNKTRQGINKQQEKKLNNRSNQEPIIKQSRMYYLYFWLILHLWLEWAYR